jgi:hypothetical protein
MYVYQLVNEAVMCDKIREAMIHSGGAEHSDSFPHALELHLDVKGKVVGWNVPLMLRDKSRNPDRRGRRLVRRAARAVARRYWPTI